MEHLASQKGRTTRQELREIQDLSTGLSSKIWQKIMILDATSLRP